MSGSCSSVVWSAVLRLTIGVVPVPADAGGDPGAPPAAADGATPGGVRSPTTICSPSTRTRARFSAATLTPWRAPPTARSASTTRDPGGRVAMPGRRTLPTTSTTTEPRPATVVADPVGEAGAAPEAALAGAG